MNFLKDICTVRYFFINLYGVDPDTLISGQMLLVRNDSSQEKTFNFKVASETTYVKETNSLSREQITVMALLTSELSSSAPNLEFAF